MEMVGSSSSKPASVSHRQNQQPQKSTEEKLFGKGIMESKAGSPQNTVQTRISMGLILCAIMIVLSSGLIFILGSNVFIQWRTIQHDNKRQTLAKVGYIILSLIGMAVIFQINVLIVRRLKLKSAQKTPQQRGHYRKLQNNEEEFEMQDL